MPSRPRAVNARKTLQDQLSPEEFGDGRQFVTYLGAISQVETPNEPAEPALLEGKPLLPLLGRLGCIGRNGEDPAPKLDFDVVLGETRQFDGRSHEVLVSVFVHVRPARKSQQSNT